MLKKALAHLSNRIHSNELHPYPVIAPSSLNTRGRVILSAIQTISLFGAGRD